MSQPPEYPGPPPQPPGYGAPPPPPPGYGGPPPPGYGPQQGGYGAPPPPPPGPPPGYGAPPPGYGAPPPGYGAPPPGYAPPAPRFSVGDAISWAWNKFTSNAVTLIVPVLVYGVIISILVGLTQFLPALDGQSNSTYTDSNGQTYGSTTVTLGFGAVTVMVIGSILLLAAGIYMHAAMTSGCLDIADGKPVTIGTFFKPRNLRGAILASLLVAVGTWIGTLLCVIPGIIFGFLALFTVPFVIDRSLSPVESVKASIATVRSNVGGTLLSWLVQIAAILIGEVLCLVGLLAGVPIAQLVLTYTYRKLSGGQVVAVEQPGYPQGPPPGMPPGSYPA